MAPKPMTIGQLEVHPALPQVARDPEPTRHGIAKIARERVQDVKLSWGIYGHGPTKLLVWVNAASLMLLPLFLFPFPLLSTTLVLPLRCVAAMLAHDLMYDRQLRFHSRDGVQLPRSLDAGLHISMDALFTVSIPRLSSETAPPGSDAGSF